MKIKNLFIVWLCCVFAISFTGCNGGGEEEKIIENNVVSSGSEQSNQSDNSGSEQNIWKIEGVTIHSDQISAGEPGKYKYQVGLTLHDPDDKIQKVTVTGPGNFVFGTEMTKIQGGSIWWNINVFSETIPSGELLYTFTIKMNATTDTESYIVENNFIDLVTNMNPVMDEILSDQPIFTWDGIDEENVEYFILLNKMTEIFDNKIPMLVDSQFVTATTWQSDGILEDGDYVWSVTASIKNDLTVSSISKELSFTLSQ